MIKEDILKNLVPGYLIENFGIYNYSDDWQCSWYEFAIKIFEDNNVNIIVEIKDDKDFKADNYYIDSI